MGYSIQWDNAEKTVILQKYTDDPVKNDLYALAEVSAKMVKSVPHMVHIIIDERAIKLELTFADMKYLEMNVPPNQGTVIIVVAKRDMIYKKVVQGVGRTMAPNAFSRPFFAVSIEAARQILREQYGVQYDSDVA